MIGTITKADLAPMRNRKGHMLKVALSCAGQTVSATFFNGHKVKYNLQPGVKVMFSGTVKTFGRSWSLSHPSYLLVDETDDNAALYGASAGIVRSDVMIALADGEGMPVGLFAVGCRTPGHFEAGQGTELIAFLAHVTRYAVGRWWTLQL